jgi:hypothetical protein
VATRTDRELGEVLDFLRLLWAIEHRLRSTSKYMQRRLGITGPQRLVLRIVEKFPGITANEISAIIHLHPATLTGIVNRLAAGRLITRVRDARDGRRVRLVASAPTVGTSPSVTVESAVASAFSELSARQISHACTVLDVVASKLEIHNREEAGLRRPKKTRTGRAGTRRRSSRRAG